jgi:hypothetical protein
MNSIQNARYKAYSLALAHLKENEAITKGVPAFETAYLTAKQTLDAIAGAGNLQQQKFQAFSAGKKQYHDEICNQALAIASAIVTYASGKNDQGLKESMSFTHTELFYAPDNELGAKTANILATARAMEKELDHYGITTPVLDHFATLVKQYLPSANEPRNMVAERKEAGEQIKKLMKQLKEQMTNQLDRLMLQFKFTHQEFYNQYIIKRSVINPSRRKTRVEGVVTDVASLAGIGDVQVMVKDTSYITLTLADGSYSLKTPALAAATILYRKEGYAPASVQVEIKRGQASNQPMALQPV